MYGNNVRGLLSGLIDLGGSKNFGTSLPGKEPFRSVIPSHAKTFKVIWYRVRHVWLSYSRWRKAVSRNYNSLSEELTADASSAVVF